MISKVSDKTVPNRFESKCSQITKKCLNLLAKIIEIQSEETSKKQISISNCTQNLQTDK